MNLRILTVTPYPLVPTVSGGRLRTFHLLSELLKRGHTVTNLDVSSESASGTWPDGSMGPSLFHIPARERIGVPAKLDALLSRYPEGPWNCSPPRVLDQWTRETDAAILFHANVGRFADPLLRAGIPLVYCAENVESELVRRLARMSLTRFSGMRFRLDAHKFARFEASLVRRADLVTAVSARDALQLMALAPGSRVELLPSGADIRGVQYRSHDHNQSDKLLFVGTLGYLPNLDAVKWLAQEIMPRVLARRSTVAARVVGSSPPDAMGALHGESLQIVGLVPDVRPELAAADVFVAPLRAGGGTRLKVLEAFAAGIPVVATSIAAEGLDVIDGVHLAIADDADSFAESILHLLVDVPTRRAMATAARRLVEERYDWSVIGARLDALLHEVVFDPHGVN